MGSQSVNPKAYQETQFIFFQIQAPSPVESKQTKCQAFIKQMEKGVSQMPINYKSLAMFAM